MPRRGGGDPGRKGTTIGCKVPDWKAEAFREIARQNRTTVSAILRTYIDSEIESSDVDREIVEEIMRKQGTADA